MKYYINQQEIKTTELLFSVVNLATLFSVTRASQPKKIHQKQLTYSYRGTM